MGLRNKVLGLFEVVKLQQILAKDVQCDCVRSHVLIVLTPSLLISTLVFCFFNGFAFFNTYVLFNVFKTLLGKIDTKAVVFHLLLKDSTGETCVSCILTQTKLLLQPQSEFELVKSLLPKSCLLVGES